MHGVTLSSTVKKIVMIVIITNDSFILKITRVIFITFIIFGIATHLEIKHKEYST